MKILGIKQGCFEMIKQSSKEVYPNEFLALLSLDDNKTAISELVLLPGTVYGESHAIFKLFMAPYDSRLVGTVHSHPSKNPYPSSGDLNLFGKYGNIHIIIAYPFEDDTWKAFDRYGNELSLEILT